MMLGARDITQNLKQISPITRKFEYKNLNSFGEPIIRGFACMDIETMEINGIQIPVAISYIRATRVTSQTIKKKLFLIDPILLREDPELAAKYLFLKLLQYLSDITSHTIYVHNLGSFDGYFIFKYFSQLVESDEINSIIDNSNKFIQIEIEVYRSKTPDKGLFGKYKFLDSYRIFPSSP